MAISPQRLTIYLYSVHRAVIFAIAQLSCFILGMGEAAPDHTPLRRKDGWISQIYWLT